MTSLPIAREESATDVASELTDLIQTQRAYSSNAKVIQTVDEMLAGNHQHQTLIPDALI